MIVQAALWPRGEKRRFESSEALLYMLTVNVHGAGFPAYTRKHVRVGIECYSDGGITGRCEVGWRRMAPPHLRILALLDDIVAVHEVVRELLDFNLREPGFS